MYYIMVLVVTFILAWLSYKYVELPAMNWNRRKKPRQPPAIQQATIPSGVTQIRVDVQPEIVPELVHRVTR